MAKPDALTLDPVVEAVLRWHGGGKIDAEQLDAVTEVDLSELTPVALASAFQSAGLEPRVLGRRELPGFGAAVARRTKAMPSGELFPVVLFGRDGRVTALLPSPTEPGGWRMADGAGMVRPFRSVGEWKSHLRQSHKRVMLVAPILSMESSPDSPGGSRDHASNGHWFADAIWRAKGEFLHVLPASLLINGFAISMSLFIMAVYDRVVPNNAIETLWVLASGVFVVFAFEFVIRLLRGAFVDSSGKAIDNVLSERIFGHTLALDLKARPSSAGSFSGQARAYETVREFLSSATIVGLVDFPFALLMFLLIFWLGGPVGWVPVVTSTAALAVVLLSQPFLRRLSGDSYQKMINRHSLFSETANGLESVKAANAAEPLRERMREAVDACAVVDLKSKRISQFGTSFTALCINLTTVGVIVASVYQVAEGRMTMGAMIACVMIVGRGMAPLAQISNLLLRLQATISAVRGLNRIMALPREDAGVLLRRRIRFPEISLSEVGFSYIDQSIPSLKGVNITIRPGMRIGLIGKAGSGKTTLLRLLARQFIPSEGLITIDGLDASQLHPNDVRRTMGYLPQDGTLFYGSVRDNILLSEDLASMARVRSNDERLLKSAERAGVLEWTNRHPLGLNVPVGERGVMLSGGQRQAVLLARCLLNDPDILLLDEPTASMDLSAEKRFLETIRAWLHQNPSRTLVLSTHRLGLLKLVDQVILLDQGKVRANGTREEVIELLKTAGRGSSGDMVNETSAESLSNPSP